MLAFGIRPQHKTTHQHKAVFQRGAVACGRCATSIHIFRLNSLADEFSVHCQTCGYRSMHSKRYLCIEDRPERRRKPRS